MIISRTSDEKQREKRAYFSSQMTSLLFFSSFKTASPPSALTCCVYRCTYMPRKYHHRLLSTPLPLRSLSLLELLLPFLFESIHHPKHSTTTDLAVRPRQQEQSNCQKRRVLSKDRRRREVTECSASRMILKRYLLVCLPVRSLTLSFSLSSPLFEALQLNRGG